MMMMIMMSFSITVVLSTVAFVTCLPLLLHLRQFAHIARYPGCIRAETVLLSMCNGNGEIPSTEDW